MNARERTLKFLRLLKDRGRIVLDSASTDPIALWPHLADKKFTVHYGVSKSLPGPPQQKRRKIIRGDR